MSGPVRTRQACDRCHSQKLRCPKRAGTAVCGRCFKMNAPCVFSAIGTGRTIQRAIQDTPPTPPAAVINSPIAAGSAALEARTSHDPVALAMAAAVSAITPPDGEGWGVGMDLDFGSLGREQQHQQPSAGGLDWLTFGAVTDIQAGLGSPDDVNARPEIIAPDVISPPTTSEESAEAAEGAGVGQRLAKLCGDFDGIYDRMPSPSALHMPVDATLEEHMSQFVTKYAGKDFMEGIFTLTQRLIDLYPSAAAAVFPPEAGAGDETGAGDGDPNGASGASRPCRPHFQSCKLAHCIHHQSAVPDELAELEESMRPQVLDLALANQLVACHLRLLDVLERLVVCAITCSRFLAVSPDHSEPEFNLPDLKVGSFTPPRHSAALMQAVLLKNLLDRLQHSLELFTAAVAERTPSPSSPLSLRALALQVELLNERHTQEVGQIRALGVRLMDRGWVG